MEDRGKKGEREMRVHGSGDEGRKEKRRREGRSREKGRV